MPSTTSDFSVSSTAYYSQDAGQWSAVDHPLFYYDPEFGSFIQDKLTSLEQLQDGWDGDGAPEINRDVIVAIREFVKALPSHVAIRPMVVPLASGNVQLEWHHGEIVLELEFESADSVHYLKWKPSRGIEDEAIISAANRNELIGLIRWFMGEVLNEQ